MRKALYICYFNTEEPLVHTQVLPYLRAVARAGTKIHLLTYEKRSAWRSGERERRRRFKRMLEAEGIGWHALTYHKRPPLIATCFDLTVGLLYCAWLVVRHHIGIVHARSHVAGLMGLLLKRMLFIKLIFDFRGLLAEEYVDNGVWATDSLPFRMVKSVERSLLKHADRVIVLTERLKALVMSDLHPAIDESKLSVIPCCVDLSKYLGREQSGAERSQRLTLVYTGTVEGRYMIGEMVDFFKALKRRRPDAHFLMIARGDKSEVERAFKLRGLDDSSYSIMSVAPAEVPALLSGAHIGISFIKPTAALAGATPTKIGEYLAAGLPVVSSAGVGDTDRILVGDGVGVIVKELGAKAYDEALDEMLDLTDNEEARDRCRRLAARHYSLKEIGEPRYIAVYESLKAADKESGKAATELIS